MSNNKIKGNFGFGCMRLKMKDGEVDKAEFNRMIDAFMNAGFNYFDTAHGYIEGKSETAIRDCLSARYNREDFVLANKLSYWTFKKEEDVLPLFESQLKLCGVEYFDYYLFHAVNRTGYEKHKQCNTFEIVKNLKSEGKIKHIGMSFHDTAEVLDEILTEQPFIEVVQLQLNYLDYDDPTIQGRACHDVAVKHGKKILVMEPVKGGALVNIPKQAEAILKELGDGSNASYALRYAASLPEVFMVLSGMGNMDMMSDNLKTMKTFVPFSEKEHQAIVKVRDIIREKKQIPCTGCNYCGEVCPGGVPVSELFSVYNKFLASSASEWETKDNLKSFGDKLLSCIQCGECETNCPQSIKIREELEKIKKLADV